MTETEFNSVPLEPDGTWDYETEVVIGHHVKARARKPSQLVQWLDEVAAKNDIERLDASPIVEIEVGDVDWDDTETISLRLSVLKEIVEVIEE